MGGNCAQAANHEPLRNKKGHAVVLIGGDASLINDEGFDDVLVPGVCKHCTCIVAFLHHQIEWVAPPE